MVELRSKLRHTFLHFMFLNAVYELLSALSIGKSSNQSILKEISPGCSLEGMMLKLKLQYFGHLT